MCVFIRYIGPEVYFENCANVYTVPIVTYAQEGIHPCAQIVHFTELRYCRRALKTFLYHISEREICAFGVEFGMVSPHKQR